MSRRPCWPLGGPAPSTTFPVKDPSIVFWQNEWHVFYTSKGRFPDGKSSSSTGYVRGRTLQDLAQAPRVELIQEGLPLQDASQVFYFRPHKLGT